MGGGNHEVRKTISLAMVVTLFMFGYVSSGEYETKTMSQKICPVMTCGDIGCSVTKNDIYTDLKGKRSIYKCHTCGYREEEYDIDGKLDNSDNRIKRYNPSNLTTQFHKDR